MGLDTDFVKVCQGKKFGRKSRHHSTSLWNLTLTPILPILISCAAGVSRDLSQPKTQLIITPKAIGPAFLKQLCTNCNRYCRFGRPRRRASI